MISLKTFQDSKVYIKILSDNFQKDLEKVKAMRAKFEGKPDNFWSIDKCQLPEIFTKWEDRRDFKR